MLSNDAHRSCLPQLRAHLTDLEVGAEEVGEAKLLVLGNGRVGKTQVCRRLRGLQYEENADSTHGITVTSCPWTGAGDDQPLNIWDFGGPDIYHGAHALFMKTRAVFLVAWWLRERIAARNRLFGDPDLEPAVDEFRADHVGEATESGREHADAAARMRAARAREAAVDERPVPAFAKLPVSAFPARCRQAFVSYAWGDDTPEGRRRGELVDHLCAALTRRGVEVLLDREQMRPGDRISEFMERLVEGDSILAVISDKYLRSPYCMYELFRVYQRCGADPERFLGKVIPLILPDARIGTVDERLERAFYWGQESNKLAARVKEHPEFVGTEAFRKYRFMGEFARNTSDMLEYLADKLEPRHFDAEGFDDIAGQLGGAAE